MADTDKPYRTKSGRELTDATDLQQMAGEAASGFDVEELKADAAAGPSWGPRRPRSSPVLTGSIPSSRTPSQPAPMPTTPRRARSSAELSAATSTSPEVASDVRLDLAGRQVSAGADRQPFAAGCSSSTK
jgi:hypothetical protein